MTSLFFGLNMKCLAWISETFLLGFFVSYLQSFVRMAFFPRTLTKHWLRKCLENHKFKSDLKYGLHRKMLTGNLTTYLSENLISNVVKWGCYWVYFGRTDNGRKLLCQISHLKSLWIKKYLIPNDWHWISEWFCSFSNILLSTSKNPVPRELKMGHKN